jgi:hypothetical protein
MHAVAAALFTVRTGFRVPIYAHVLGIFSGSSGGTRRVSRKLAGIKAPRAMPTVGWMWVRSGAKREKFIPEPARRDRHYI